MRRPSSIPGLLIAGARATSTERLTVYLSGILILSTLLLLFTSVNISPNKFHSIQFDFPVSVAHLTDKVPVPHIFKQATHKAPPPVTNSTASTEGWFSSWSWSNPFSQSKDDRIALPPLKRCPVFTYYEPSKDKSQAAIEDKILLAWRRAWWAYGFKPMILGPAEAKESNLYELLFRAELSPELEKELTKWLAWSQVGMGVFTDYGVIPMGPHEDTTLSALNRCDFGYMTGYDGFDGKLYNGDKSSIDNIIKLISSSPPDKKKSFKTINDAISSSELMYISSSPTSLADYTHNSVTKSYIGLKPEDLPDLINAHLHSTFLSLYPDGIHVLSPFAQELSALNQPAFELANRIASCQVRNPLPESCPSNIPKCLLCKRAKITKSEFITASSSSGSFLLGTVPHPLITLGMTKSSVDLVHGKVKHILRFVRRNSKRNSWLREATKDMTTALGSEPRVTKIKGLVAIQPGSRFHSMWSTEKEGFRDVEWVLGFAPPTAAELNLHLPDPEAGVMEKLDDLKKQSLRSNTAKIIEGWNLGDTEAWKFINAWKQRRFLERTQWTQEEKKFGQGLGRNERWF